MPRIPLYNKGLGPSVATATGQLSPRASAAPFMQQGQAQAAFFQQASKIAFDFAQEQQRAETNRVYSEQLKQFDEQQLDFNTSRGTSKSTTSASKSGSVEA